MTKIWDIPGFTQELWREMREQKYINVREHPEDDLYIANYSDKAQIDDVWNPVTMNCRGLIYDSWFNIVAKPFTKFFNYGQKGAAEIPLDAPVQVTDKADGSLGIIYPTGDGKYAVATRGSFVSDQAIKATQILQTKYPDFVPPDFWTVLVEIIYPENRIVLDYGDQEDLILLGGVRDQRAAYEAIGLPPREASFEVYGANIFEDGYWTGPVTEVFDYATLADALAAPPRKNAEGLVVRAVGTSDMVKIKQEDYIKLHRLVTGLNERVVWEYLKDHNGEYKGLLEGLPDEFHGWVRDKAAAFITDYNGLTGVAGVIYEGLVGDLTNDDPEAEVDRKLYAEKVNTFWGKTKYRPLLFMLLDGKDISGAVWKSLRPVGQTQQMKAISEDVA
jgi:RNA ligase